MIHNALQRFAELQRGAKIALGLDAGAGGLERMSETLQLTKDFWAYPEDALTRGETLCQGVGDAAAGGAGNYSACSLAMQVEGWIAVLERVEISVTTAGLVGIRRGLPLPTIAATRRPVDTRKANAAPIASVATINTVAALPGGTDVAFIRAVANQTYQIPLKWVLVATAPVATETACVIYHYTANQGILVNFYWRERRLLPGELLR